MRPLTQQGLTACLISPLRVIGPALPPMRCHWLRSPSKVLSFHRPFRLPLAEEEHHRTPALSCMRPVVVPNAISTLFILHSVISHAPRAHVHTGPIMEPPTTAYLQWISRYGEAHCVHRWLILRSASRGETARTTSGLLSVSQFTRDCELCILSSHISEVYQQPRGHHIM